MKRTPLKRKTPLRPAGACAKCWGGELPTMAGCTACGGTGQMPFRDADGKPLVRQAGFKRTELKPGKRKARVLVPQGVRRLAFAATGGRCIRCGEQATQLHHVLPRRLYPDLEREGMNLVPCCHGCHDEHERAHRRFTQRELGPHLWDWAVGRDRAYMQRTYPA
jgi:5-methylcytosine-specific restriction endonuclease McrA